MFWLIFFFGYIFYLHFCQGRMKSEIGSLLERKQTRQIPGKQHLFNKMELLGCSKCWPLNCWQEKSDIQTKQLFTIPWTRKVVIRYPTGLSRERQHLRELSEAISHLSLKSTLFYVLYSWSAQSQQELHILSLLCRHVRISVPRVKSIDAGLLTPKGMVFQSTPYSRNYCAQEVVLWASWSRKIGGYT